MFFALFRDLLFNKIQPVRIPKFTLLLFVSLFGATKNFAIALDSMENEFSDELAYVEDIQIVDTVVSKLSIDTVSEEKLLTTRVFSPLDTMKLSIHSRCVLEDSLYWKMINPTFAIWDSMTVDPYKVDGAKIKDTSVIVLHDDCKLENWCMPLSHDHHITSGFGSRKYRYHYGTDLRLSTGDSVRSVWDGVVRISKYNYGGYGNYVIVRHHNGLETIYGHLSERLVNVGDEILAGDLLGWGGSTGRSTGPHLHFEVRYKGNAINPAHVFAFQNNTVACNEFELTPNEFEYIRDMRKAQYHKIRSGDTLGHIAIKYHTSINQVCRLNGMSRNSVLRVGKVLRVR